MSDDYNPLERDLPFQLTLANPNPTSSKTKDGPVYRVSFELTQEDWQLFMDAETKGMVIEVFHAQVSHRNGDEAEPGASSSVQEEEGKPDVAGKEEKPKGGALARSAGLLCNNVDFQRFASLYTYVESDDSGNQWTQAYQVSEHGAKMFLYHACKITSRRDLDHSESARKRFSSVMEKYRFWREKEGLGDE